MCFKVKCDIVFPILKDSFWFLLIPFVYQIPNDLLFSIRFIFSLLHSLILYMTFSSRYFLESYPFLSITTDCFLFCVQIFCVQLYFANLNLFYLIYSSRYLFIFDFYFFNQIFFCFSFVKYFVMSYQNKSKL